MPLLPQLLAGVALAAAVNGAPIVLPTLASAMLVQPLPSVIVARYAPAARLVTLAPVCEPASFHA